MGTPGLQLKCWVAWPGWSGDPPRLGVCPKLGDAPDPSFEHLFLTCRIVQPLANRYFLNLFSFHINPRDILSRGCQEENTTSFVVNIELLLFNFYIFTKKSEGQLPTYSNLLHVLYKLKKQLLVCSQKYSRCYLKVCNKHGNEIKLHNRFLELC